MDRLFLDANILFSAAYRAQAGLLQLWKLKDVALCTFRYALEEARINLEEEDQRASLRKLATTIEIFEASEKRQQPTAVSLPVKDVPIMLAAIEARATHLLTGDIRHFGRYFGKNVEGVLVMRPGEYLRARGII